MPNYPRPRFRGRLNGLRRLAGFVWLKRKLLLPGVVPPLGRIARRMAGRRRRLRADGCRTWHRGGRLQEGQGRLLGAGWPLGGTNGMPGRRGRLRRCQDGERDGGCEVLVHVHFSRLE
jgi:hypothetical protein